MNIFFELLQQTKLTLIFPGTRMYLTKRHCCRSTQNAKTFNGFIFDDFSIFRTTKKHVILYNSVQCCTILYSVGDNFPRGVEFFTVVCHSVLFEIVIRARSGISKVVAACHISWFYWTPSISYNVVQNRTGLNPVQKSSKILEISTFRTTKASLSARRFEFLFWYDCGEQEDIARRVIGVSWFSRQVVEKNQVSRTFLLYNSVQYCTILYNAVQKFKNHDLSSQMSLLPIGWYGYLISLTGESPRLRNRLRSAHYFSEDLGSPQLPKIELTAISVASRASKS